MATAIPPGGGDTPAEIRANLRAGIVRGFVDDKSHEDRLCSLLDMPTEAEKSTNATVSAAASSKSSSVSAKAANRLSLLAIFIATCALVVSGYSIFIQFDRLPAHPDDASDQVAEQTDQGGQD